VNILDINRFDLLVILACFGMFVLGFIQGTIRFNARSRVHSEEMRRGHARALITELK